MTQLKQLNDAELQDLRNRASQELDRRARLNLQKRAREELLRREQAEVQSPSRGVQLGLEAALAAFERMDPDKWAGWVCYLLEGLEGLRPDEADHLLREVRDSIEERLELGRW